MAEEVDFIAIRTILTLKHRLEDITAKPSTGKGQHDIPPSSPSKLESIKYYKVLEYYKVLIVGSINDTLSRNGTEVQTVRYVLLPSDRYGTAIEPSVRYYYRAIGRSSYRTIGRSSYQTIGRSYYRTETWKGRYFCNRGNRTSSRTSSSKNFQMRLDRYLRRLPKKVPGVLLERYGAVSTFE